MAYLSRDVAELVTCAAMGLLTATHLPTATAKCETTQVVETLELREATADQHLWTTSGVVTATPTRRRGEDTVRLEAALLVVPESTHPASFWAFGSTVATR